MRRSIGATLMGALALAGCAAGEDISLGVRPSPPLDSEAGADPVVRPSVAGFLVVGGNAVLLITDGAALTAATEATPPTPLLALGLQSQSAVGMRAGSPAVAGGSLVLGAVNIPRGSATAGAPPAAQPLTGRGQGVVDPPSVGPAMGVAAGGATPAVAGAVAGAVSPAPAIAPTLPAPVVPTLPVPTAATAVGSVTGALGAAPAVVPTISALLH